jgi:hypothetical protein
MHQNKNMIQKLIKKKKIANGLKSKWLFAQYLDFSYFDWATHEVDKVETSHTFIILLIELCKTLAQELYTLNTEAWIWANNLTCNKYELIWVISKKRAKLPRNL